MAIKAEENLSTHALRDMIQDPNIDLVESMGKVVQDLAVLVVALGPAYQDDQSRAVPDGGVLGRMSSMFDGTIADL